MKSRYTLFSLVMITATSTAPAFAATRTVAISGQAAPGAPAAAKYNTFSPPAIDAQGRTSFVGQLLTGVGGVVNASDTGIWSERTGTLALLAREGSQAPGTPAGANFSAFSPFSINADGEVSFAASLVSGSGGVSATNNSGVWSDASGSLALVVRKPDAVTGAAAGLNIPINVAPAFNRAGAVALRAPIVGGGGSNGIWEFTGTTGTPLIISGQQAPGTAAGVTFSTFTSINLLNQGGQVAFRGLIEGPGVSSDTNGTGIWAERGGQLALVVRRGDVTPLSPIKFATLGEPTINRLGQTAFLANLTGVGVGATNNDAMWAEKDNVLSLVARAGSQAPGRASGINFDAFGEPLLNANSDVAFTATVVGANVVAANNEGVWVRKNGTLSLVADEGGLAVGGPQDAVFGSFSSLSLNSAGQVAFSATLASGLVTPETDKGLWATTLGGVLKMIAREGQAIEVAPGSTKTIASLSISAGTNEDGNGGAFNDRGELAFAATFTDGSSGVFVSDVVKSITGDFDGDLDVDGADFLAWQRGPRDLGAGHPGNGDANNDANVDGSDLNVWKTKFGTVPTAASAAASVPEPSGLALAAFVAATLAARRRRALRTLRRLALHER